MLSVRVTQLRKIEPTKGLLAFFSVSIGDRNEEGEFSPALVVRDCALKAKKDGGYWFQFPSKKRMKNGEPVLDEKEYPIWDPYVDIAGTKTSESFQMTKLGAQVRKSILEQAAKLYEEEEGGDEGRGVEPAAKAEKPAASKATTKDKEKAKAQAALAAAQAALAAAEEDDSDDLPF